MNRRVSMFVLFVSIASLVLSLADVPCAFAGDARGKEPPKAIVVLVDLSASAVASREDYVASLEKVFGAVHLGDHLFIAKITDRSEMDTRPFLDNVFLPKKMPNSYYQRQEDRKAEKGKDAALGEARKQILAYLNGSVKPSPATAILGSLQVAERIFRKDRGRTGVLVLLSDMVEATDEDNFVKGRLDSRGIEKIIARERKRGRIPDLKGVKVFVAGARTANRSRFYEIRDFWLRYFRETGGTLEKEDYGSVLLDFR